MSLLCTENARDADPSSDFGDGHRVRLRLRVEEDPRQLGPPSSDTGGKRESSDLPRHPEYPQQQRQPSNIDKITC